MLAHSFRLVVAILTFITPLTLFAQTDDANEVYRAVIQKKFIHNTTKVIVLEAETKGFWMHENDEVRKKRFPSKTAQQLLKEWMPEAQTQTLDNYLASNKSRERLQVSDLGIDYVLLKPDELPRADVEQFWTMFYRKYRDSSGIIAFSNIGFNEQHDEAFLYVENRCDGLCGQGHYVLLTKSQGKWEIRKENHLWIA
ncbi:MAG TPA: hypothetical protein VLB68_05650 [Pyrinomonadaceae bacterium]|nr:hypothetical protein [Pyrinomonadaceae bacterium]